MEKIIFLLYLRGYPCRRNSKYQSNLFEFSPINAESRLANSAESHSRTLPPANSPTNGAKRSNDSVLNESKIKKFIILRKIKPILNRHQFVAYKKVSDGLENA